MQLKPPLHKVDLIPYSTEVLCLLLCNSLDQFGSKYFVIKWRWQTHTLTGMIVVDLEGGSLHGHLLGPAPVVVVDVAVTDLARRRRRRTLSHNPDTHQWGAEPHSTSHHIFYNVLTSNILSVEDLGKYRLDEGPGRTETINVLKKHSQKYSHFSIVLSKVFSKTFTSFLHEFRRVICFFILTTWFIHGCTSPVRIITKQQNCITSFLYKLTWQFSFTWP